MGCRWVTIAGRRVRVGPAAPARVAMRQDIAAALELLQGAGIKFVRLSPELPVEQLTEAVLRLWQDEETGYMVEVRARPLSPPVYHHVTDQEARLIQARKPPRELLERLFRPEEPGYE